MHPVTVCFDSLTDGMGRDCKGSTITLILENEIFGSAKITERTPIRMYQLEDI